MLSLKLIIGIVLISIVYESTAQYNISLHAPPYVLPGSPYLLTCLVEPNNVSIEWHTTYPRWRPVSTSAISSENCTVEADVNFEYKCGTQTQEQGEFILTVLSSDFLLEIRHWYCRTVNTNPLYWSNTIVVLHPRAPAIVVIHGTSNENGSLHLYVRETQPYSLTCKAYGARPEAEVTLMTMGMNLTSQISSLSYTFTPTLANQQQEYSCIANHIMLETPMNVTVQLNVTFRPKLLNVLKNISVIESKTNVVQFACPQVEANPPKIRYNWTKSGVQVGTEQNLVINNVSRIHAGQYTCIITNYVGSSEPSHAYLNVLYPSEVTDLQLNSSNTVQENSAVGMKCLVDSHPLSKVVWFHLDTQSILKTDYNITQSDFTLSATTCEDTGQYACTAYNGIGLSSNRTLQLQVLCAPKLVQLHKMADNLSIKLGTEIQLSLTIISNPDPTIKWFLQISTTAKPQPLLFASAEVQNSGVVYKAKLKKDITSKSDLGLYIASVLNSHGSVEHIFRVSEQAGVEAGAAQNNSAFNTGSIAILATGVFLCIVGISFFMGTLIFRRRKKNKSRGKGEDNTGYGHHFYDDLNTTQVNTAGNTYAEIQVTETVAGRI